jgi:hypothetical protein
VRQGAVALAFSSLGKGGTRASDGTSHANDALAGVSIVAHRVQSQRVADLLSSGAQKWFIAVKAFDGTPIDVEFGDLQSVLAPVARYHLKTGGEGSSASFKMLSHSDFSKLGFRCRFGILEMLAVTCKLLWPKTCSGIGFNEEHVLCRPRFIGGSDANSIAAGVEASVVNLSDLLSLTTRMPFVVLVLPSDMHGSNLRYKAWAAQVIQAHNEGAEAKGCGKCLLLEPFCAAHVLTRIIIVSLGYTAFIPRMYALSFCCRFSPRFNRRNLRF